MAKTKSEKKIPVIEAFKKLPDIDKAHILASLPSGLRDILRLRFNINVNDNREYKFAEIGELIGLTAANKRSRPSQATAQVLCKLRNPLRFDILRDKISKEDYNG